LGSIVGATLIPILAILFKSQAVYVGLGLLIAIFVIYRHQPNIKRLLAGEENKIGWNVDVDKKNK
jgi:glycerol-3-phosphate acyltransferase PlsY